MNQLRTAGMALFSVLTAQLGFYMAYTFLSLFAQENLGLNLAFIGSLFALRHFVQIFLRVPVGALSDYVGRKRMILLGLLCYAGALGIFYATYHWVYLLLGLLVHAVGMCCLFPALFALIGDCYSKKTGAGLGKLFMMIEGGTLLGPIIGGTILTSQRLDVAYRILFLGAAAIVTVGFLVTWILMEDSLPDSRRLPYTNVSQLLRSHLQESMVRFRQLIHNRSVLVAGIPAFFMGFPLVIVNLFFPLLGDARGFTKDEIGLALGLRSVVPTLFFVPLGSISDRYGPFVPALLALTVIGLSLFSIPFAFSLLLYIFFLMAARIAWGIVVPALNKILFLGVSETDRGVTTGTWGVFIASGRTVASLLVGFVASLFGLEAAFLLGGFMLFLAALLFFHINTPLARKASTLE